MGKDRFSRCGEVNNLIPQALSSAGFPANLSHLSSHAQMVVDQMASLSVDTLTPSRLPTGTLSAATGVEGAK